MPQTETTHRKTWQGECTRTGMVIVDYGDAAMPTVGERVTVDGDTYAITEVDPFGGRPKVFVEVAIDEPDADATEAAREAYATAEAAHQAEVTRGSREDRELMIPTPRRATAQEIDAQDAAADL